MNILNALQTKAAARPPTTEAMQEFKPTPAHEAIAAVLNDGQDTSVNAKALANSAGVSLRTFQRAVSDPACLTWIVAQQSMVAGARLGAVHGRIYAMAMSSKSPGWAKLFLERFDNEFKQQKILEKGSNQQFNFGDMTHEELIRTILRSFRQVQGVAAPLGVVGPGVPGDLGQAGGVASVSSGSVGECDPDVRHLPDEKL